VQELHPLFDRVIRLCEIGGEACDALEEGNLFDDAWRKQRLAEIDSAAEPFAACEFLFVAALFQMVDGAQVVGAGMLRGLHDTRVPMLYALVGYWVVGIGTGVWLGFGVQWAGVGIWTGLATGLAFVSVLMIRRWSKRDALGLLPA